VRKPLRAMFPLLALILSSSPSFPWGREGHQVVGLIAEKYMTTATLAKAGDLLDGSAIDAVASWADEYRRDHRETAPWHYIDIPLADSKIDLARECPNGECVIVKTEQFLAVLKDPNAGRDAKAQALKFVIHFVGDMHQPLHVTDNGDKGGNRRYVVFERHPDNLHWVWDTGLLQHITRNPAALAAELESGGETCVIELSGLAARNFRVPRDRRQFRQERIDVIRRRMFTYRPVLVVMYGKSEKKDYEKIAGCLFPAGNILKLGSTIIAFTSHPVAYGKGKAYWAELGERLRQEASLP